MIRIKHKKTGKEYSISQDSISHGGLLNYLDAATVKARMLKEILQEKGLSTKGYSPDQLLKRQYEKLSEFQILQ